MPDGWLYNSIKLNTDGTSTATCYYLSDLGLQILLRETYEDAGAAQTAHVIAPSPFCGDGSRMFTNTLLGSGVYRVENGKATELPGPADYTDAGGYLSSSILRQFRCNEGYYDIDLQTGEEILLSDPRLENSRSFILLPNCILETTLGSEKHREGDPHAMALFDGKDWHPVALPSELTEAFTADMTVTVGAVTSDRILLLVYENQRFSRCSVYQILLGNRNLTLEPCGKLG